MWASFPKISPNPSAIKKNRFVQAYGRLGESRTVSLLPIIFSAACLTWWPKIIIYSGTHISCLRTKRAETVQLGKNCFTSLQGGGDTFPFTVKSGLLSPRLISLRRIISPWVKNQEIRIPMSDTVPAHLAKRKSLPDIGPLR